MPDAHRDQDATRSGTPPLCLRRLALLLRRWVEEPIGLFVPLIAVLLMLFAPQMPDMFIAMVAGDGPTDRVPEWLQAMLELGLPAAWLGLLAWYWMRAALWESCTFPDRVRFFAQLWGARPVPLPSEQRQMEQWLDSSRGANEADNWSHLRAPRVTLFLAGLIALSPVCQTLRDADASLADAPWGTMLAPLPVLAALAAVVWRRHLGLDWQAPTPVWMWRTRPTALLASAPFGWPVAVFLLLLSAIGCVVTGRWPETMDLTLATPTLALLALGLLIGPLALALALLRELILRILLWISAGLAYVRESRRGEPDHSLDAIGLVGLSNVLALVALVTALYFEAPLGEPDSRYRVRQLATPLDEGEPPKAPGTAPTAGTASNTVRRPDIREALKEWYDFRAPPGSPDRAIPAIVVAAEGGASRGAVWMLSSMRMLDRATGNEFGRHLFAISGVSGGSLGAVTYLQALRAYGDDRGGLKWKSPQVESGLWALGTGDLLGASIATYFLNDTLGRLFGALWPLEDRAIALEQTFERHWQRQDGFGLSRQQAEAGLLALHGGLASRPDNGQRKSPRGMLPHLLLNGTDRETGRRLITSTLRFDPEHDLFAASDDLLGILGHDVPSSTAVTNSARFPFISPAGRFVSGEDHRQVLDGGYFENYGARTAAELADALARIAAAPVPPGGRRLNVVPIVVVISNDADAARGEKDAAERKLSNPMDVTVTCAPPQLLPPGLASARALKGAKNTPEFLAPVLGLAATRGAHGQDAQHILRRQLCTAPDVPRLIHIALPKPRPGSESAPMNWVLNKRTADFLLNTAHGSEDTDFNPKQVSNLVNTLRALGVP